MRDQSTSTTTTPAIKNSKLDLVLALVDELPQEMYLWGDIENASPTQMDQLKKLFTAIYRIHDLLGATDDIDPDVNAVLVKLPELILTEDFDEWMDLFLKNASAFSSSFVGALDGFLKGCDAFSILFTELKLNTSESLSSTSVLDSSVKILENTVNSDVVGFNPNQSDSANSVNTIVGTKARSGTNVPILDSPMKKVDDGANKVLTREILDGIDSGFTMVKTCGRGPSTNNGGKLPSKILASVHVATNNSFEPLADQLFEEDDENEEEVAYNELATDLLQIRTNTLHHNEARDDAAINFSIKIKEKEETAVRFLAGLSKAEASAKELQKLTTLASTNTQTLQLYDSRIEERKDFINGLSDKIITMEQKLQDYNAEFASLDEKLLQLSKHVAGVPDDSHLDHLKSQLKDSYPHAPPFPASHTEALDNWGPEVMQKSTGTKSDTPVLVEDVTVTSLDNSTVKRRQRSEFLETSGGKVLIPADIDELIRVKSPKEDMSDKVYVYKANNEYVANWHNSDTKTSIYPLFTWIQFELENQLVWAFIQEYEFTSQAPIYCVQVNGTMHEVHAADVIRHALKEPQFANATATPSLAAAIGGPPQLKSNEYIYPFDPANPRVSSVTSIKNLNTGSLQTRLVPLSGIGVKSNCREFYTHIKNLLDDLNVPLRSFDEFQSKKDLETLLECTADTAYSYDNLHTLASKLLYQIFEAEQKFLLPDDNFSVSSFSNYLDNRDGLSYFSKLIRRHHPTLSDSSCKEILYGPKFDISSMTIHDYATELIKFQRQVPGYLEADIVVHFLRTIDERFKDAKGPLLAIINRLCQISNDPILPEEYTLSVIASTVIERCTTDKVQQNVLSGLPKTIPTTSTAYRGEIRINKMDQTDQSLEHDPQINALHNRNSSSSYQNSGYQSFTSSRTSNSNSKNQRKLCPCCKNFCKDKCLHLGRMLALEDYRKRFPDLDWKQILQEYTRNQLQFQDKVNRTYTKRKQVRANKMELKKQLEAEHWSPSFIQQQVDDFVQKELEEDSEMMFCSADEKIDKEEKKGSDLVRNVMKEIHGMMSVRYNHNRHFDDIITNNHICTNTYWNDRYDDSPTPKTEPRKRKSRHPVCADNEYEYLKSKLKKGIRSFRHTVKSMKQNAKSMQLPDVLQNMEEMHWVKNGKGGFRDVNREPIAPQIPFDEPPSVFRDLGFNVHLQPDLNMLADNFLTEMEDDSVLGTSSDAPVNISASVLGSTKNSGSISDSNETGSVLDSKEKGSISEIKISKLTTLDDDSDCATVLVTNCKSVSSVQSLIHDPPWLDLDYLPYDERADRGFMMEDIIQVHTSSAPQHSGHQCDPGANANITNGENVEVTNVKHIRPINVGQIGAEGV